METRELIAYAIVGVALLLAAFLLFRIKASSRRERRRDDRIHVHMQD